MLALLPLLAVASASPFAVYPEHKAAELSNVQGFHIPLSHSSASVEREVAKRAGGVQDGTWLIREEAFVDERYNAGVGGFKSLLATHVKRQSGAVQLQNNGIDASYSGQVSIGTPAQSFSIILDTGSSDLWVEDSQCAQCQGTKYDPSKSSSFKTSNAKFSISYGSGDAAGRVAQDTVSMGGQVVSEQVFAVVDSMSPNLIATSVSGIMGLAFQALAYSKSAPWWQGASGNWKEKLFAFYMKRYRDTGADRVEEDGGLATFGYLDPSLYSGDVTYVDVPANPQYWQIPMAGVSMQGKTVELGSSNQVAVDTGTTLVGGPADIVANIYAAIPGSRAMSGQYKNYYEYPCDTNIDLKLTFGSYVISIENDDFNLGRYGDDQAYCTGGIFVQALSANSPVSWIVGATALKNTYTVFRFEPPAIGFAAIPSEGNVADANSNANAAANVTATASSASTSASTSASIDAAAGPASANPAAALSSSSSKLGAPSPAPSGSASSAAPSAATAVPSGTSGASSTGPSYGLGLVVALGLAVAAWA